jgi:RNA polymerase sigma factor (sigma-70 family)
MPPIEQFVRACEPIVRDLARKLLGKYSGWFKDPAGELGDLIQVGLLRIITIYPKIDFNHGAYKAFVYRSASGAMLNYIEKNIPHITPDKQFVKQIPLEDIVKVYEEFYNEKNDIELDINLLIFKTDVLHTIDSFMKLISPLERFILISKFSDNKTYTDIGKCLGSSRKAIPQMLEQLVERLVTFFQEQKGWTINTTDLEEYLKESELPR